jgi:HAD superfamily hydrolase (TIGR01509 family)
VAPLAWQVVFDLDGLMVDSEPMHELANDRYFARLGTTLDESLREEMMGRRVRDLAEAIAGRLGRSPDDVFAEREAVFWELLEQSGVKAMPGLDQAIAMLGGAGLPLAVATSGTRAYVDHVLDRLGIRGAFAVVVSGEDVTAGKPDPEIYLRAAELLRADPADCVAFEDTFHGVAAARAAGMRAIAIPNDLTAAMDFSAADAVLPDLVTAAELVLATPPPSS